MRVSIESLPSGAISTVTRDSRSGIVRQAENAVRVAEHAYRFGERGFLDVLDAQRVYRAARNELISARYEAAAIWAEIERLRASTVVADASTTAPQN